jgi:hypothetical protein
MASPTDRRNTPNEAFVELAVRDNLRFPESKENDLIIYNTNPSASVFAGTPSSGTYVHIGANSGDQKTVKILSDHKVSCEFMANRTICHGTLQTKDLSINGNNLTDILGSLRSGIESSISQHISFLFAETVRTRDAAQSDIERIHSAVNLHVKDVYAAVQRSEIALRAYIEDEIRKQSSRMEDRIQAQRAELLQFVAKDMRAQLHTVLAESVRLEMKDEMRAMRAEFSSSIAAEIAQHHEEASSKLRADMRSVHVDMQFALREKIEHDVYDKVQPVVMGRMRADMTSNLTAFMSKYERSMTDSVDQRLRNKIAELGSNQSREMQAVTASLGTLQDRVKAIGTDVDEAQKSLHGAQIEWRCKVVEEREAVLDRVNGICVAAAQQALKTWSVSDWPALSSWLKHNVADVVDDTEARLLALHTDAKASIEDVSGNVSAAKRRGDGAFELAQWCSNAFAKVGKDLQEQEKISRERERRRELAMVAPAAAPPPTLPSLESEERDAGKSNALVTYLDRENKPVLSLMDELYHPPFAIVPPLVESPCKSGIGLWSRSPKGSIAFYAGIDRVGLPVERMRLTTTGLDVRGTSTFDELREKGTSLCERYVSQEAYNALIEELIAKKVLESRLHVTTLFSDKSTAATLTSS